MERIDVQRRSLDRIISFSYWSKGQHGIFLSGGIDSLALLHWISIDAPQLLQRLSAITIKKENTCYAEKIAAQYSIKNHFFVSAGNRQGEAAGNAIKEHPEIEIFYGAVTALTTDAFEYSGEKAKRGDRPGPKVQLPFIDFDKRYSLQLAIDLVAPIEMTHSCTTYENEHCGKCYMCAERRWAFRKLNIADKTYYTET